jgi:hypothetical protein
MGIEALLLSQVITISGTTGQVVTKQADGSLALENAAGGGVGGSTGATDNAILRADGTGGATLQSSGVTISDNSEVLIVSGAVSAVPLIVKGAASQTGNLQEWQTSASAVGCSIDSGGRLKIPAGGTIQVGNSFGNRLSFSDGATFTLGLRGEGLILPSTANTLVAWRSGAGATFGWGQVIMPAAGRMQICTSPAGLGHEVATVEFDKSTTAGDTRMLLWDVDKGSLQRVSIGVADSGGVGFKLLRVPN